jgi:DNA-binding IclR family transcriptional regulator
MLSPKIYELGMVAVDQFDIRTVIFGFMSEIVKKTEESTALYIRHNFQRICIEKLESPHDLRRVVTLGRSLPLCVGSSGKVLLAWMSYKLQQSYLDDLKKNPPEYFKKNFDQFEKELSEIKKQGFAISSGERVPDSISASVPIFQISGEVLALTVMGPSVRINSNKLQGMIDIIKEVSNKVSYISNHNLTA